MNENKEIMYWNPTTKSVYAGFQLGYRTEEEISQLVPIDADIWYDVLDKINSQNYILGNDPEKNIPIAVKAPEPTEAEKASSEILRLKDYLYESDWKVIKASELGVPLSELYPDDNTKRSEARAKINELEKLLT